MTFQNSASHLPLPEESVVGILGQTGKKRFYPKNTVILNEGDPSSTLYIIHSGKLKVFLADEQGREIVLNIVGAGDYFGEMALIDNETRSASVMTLEDAQLTLVSKEDFNACLTRKPELALPLMLELIKRLRNSIRKVGSLALLDVHGRVAKALLQLAGERDGKLVIEQKLTHQEIANIVGASREMVSRIMHNLTEDGYISIDSQKRITLNEKL